jgi:hypothetical protein
MKTVVIGLGLAFSSAALADPPGPPGGRGGQEQPVGKSSITIRVVHATQSGRVDPALKPVEAQLRFTRFTGFTQLSSNTTQVAEGGETSVPVPGGRRVRVQLLDRTPTQARARVRLFEAGEPLADTTQTVPRGKAMIIGGPKYDGGVLLLLVTVN